MFWGLPCTRIRDHRGHVEDRPVIQAALGMNPLPTNAQRLNDKSGVALKVESQISAKRKRHKRRTTSTHSIAPFVSNSFASAREMRV